MLPNFKIEPERVCAERPQGPIVKELDSNEEDRAIATAIISMGKAHGLTLVAEGVETTEQDQFLREHACDELQRFLFSKPVSPEEIDVPLRPHRSIPAATAGQQSRGHVQTKADFRTDGQRVNADFAQTDAGISGSGIYEDGKCGSRVLITMRYSVPPTLCIHQYGRLGHGSQDRGPLSLRETGCNRGQLDKKPFRVRDSASAFREDSCGDPRRKLT